MSVLTLPSFVSFYFLIIIMQVKYHLFKSPPFTIDGFSPSWPNRLCFLKGTSIDLRCWCCFSLWEKINTGSSGTLHHSFTLQSSEQEDGVCPCEWVSEWVRVKKKVMFLFYCHEPGLWDETLHVVDIYIWSNLNKS